MMKRYIALFIITAFVMSCGRVRSGGSADGCRHGETQVPLFDADSAYSYVEMQCLFGPRVPGMESHLECLDYLVRKFNDFGADTVIVQSGTTMLYNGKRIDLKNIIVSYNPFQDNRILVCSHWDSRPFADNDPDPLQRHTPIIGANDGASGVGVIMELARQFSLQRPDLGIDFILFDLEDWGAPEWEHSQSVNGGWALGSEYWASHPHVPGYKAQYGVLLDMVGAPGAMFFREYMSDYYASWVVDKVWNRAAALGLSDVFVNSRGGAITDDHLNVNRIAGIPCIDIIQYNPYSETGFSEYWHTQNDTHHNIDRNTLAQVGTVLLNLIYRP